MLLSMTPAIIAVNFPNAVRGKIFGYISLATTVALSIGYGVGGPVSYTHLDVYKRQLYNHQIS